MISNGRNRFISCARTTGVKPLRVRADVNQSAVIVVVAEDQGVERLAAERIPADDELLAAIDPHLLPGPRAQARLVPAVAPLRHQSFEPLRLNGGKSGRARVAISAHLSAELAAVIRLRSSPAGGFRRKS